MHSSRMRTVLYSSRLAGGVSSWGVSAQGVSAWGLSAQGDVSAQGGGCLPGGCLPDTPMTHRMIDRCKNITLPQHHRER